MDEQERDATDRRDAESLGEPGKERDGDQVIMMSSRRLYVKSEVNRCDRKMRQPVHSRLKMRLT